MNNRDAVSCACPGTVKTHFTLHDHQVSLVLSLYLFYTLLVHGTIIAYLLLLGHVCVLFSILLVCILWIY